MMFPISTDAGTDGVGPSQLDGALLRFTCALSPADRLERHDQTRMFALSVWRTLMKIEGVKSTLDVFRCLNEWGVDFVVIGGVAAVAHGSPRITFDLDICALLDSTNSAKLYRAASVLNSNAAKGRYPTLFASIRNECFDGLPDLHFTTDAGPLDVLTEVCGVGDYAANVANSVAMDFAGVRCRILGLNSLIRAKLATDRLKDKLAIRELDAITKNCPIIR